ncbi:ABC-type transport system involved in resistance to organic solvents, periplasmic component [Beggiatoa alba B18LD]|uniref:ABC-type transport system involved in resistance to organic solvents, periplasmic component n=1 Tax=Beggiatoa alba B18LD TaxID=395493 RepID=I3CFS0_9GAMM|nr:MlaD family protein [Beggiatoa alba]EIJ42463.1 ABC-type transport system involved in resistance to organic solvents, periplasmic component [Beggiatoa alba B18LD]
MDNKANYALVGLFVIILSIVMIASVLWLTVGTEEKVYITYQIYIHESVSGLNVKSPVKYKGVEVGYVHHISLDPNRPDEVQVLLKIEWSTPIRQDTTATLSSQGLTGLAYIELTGGTGEFLSKEPDIGDEYPELKTKPSLLVRLDTAVSELMGNLNKVSTATDGILADIKNLTTSVDDVFSQQNRTMIAKTLQNIETLTHTLANRSTLIDNTLVSAHNTLENSAQVTKDLPNLLNQLAKTLSSLEQTAQQFTKTANTINTVVDASRSDIGKTTQAIAKAAQGVEITVNQSKRGIDSFTQQTLPEVNNTLRELRELIANLRGLSRELERNPNIIFFGKSKSARGPGEK